MPLRHHLFDLTDRQLADFVTKPVRILVIVVLAVLVRALIGRTIARLVTSTREGRVGRRLSSIGQRAPLFVDTSEAAVGRRQQRAATLGTVLRSITNTVIGVIAVTTVLGEVGINLAPIVAGAGIIGVAIGFGAQNLVRDFLSGLFLMIEDTYGVGDTVDLGPAVGTVESIGLRSTRIRDVHGTLWSVRNGEIVRVANYSQVWQRTLFDVLVLHGEDLSAASETLLRTAESLAGTAEFIGVLLEPPAVWGVQEVRPEGVVVRLAIRRKTGRDDFDRALREATVNALTAAGMRISSWPLDVRLVDPRQTGACDGSSVVPPDADQSR